MTPAKTTKPHDDTATARDRVFAAAARLFARQGFAGSSMRDLAREAEMSLSGLYHYFPGKDELLYEIQREAFDRFFEPLSKLDESTSPEERIRHLIANHLKFFAEHITEMKVLSHEAGALAEPLRRRMRRARRRYYDLCLGIVQELLDKHGRSDLDPGIATMTLFGMINWIYTWFNPMERISADELAAQMSAIFLTGVTTQQTKSER